MTMQTTKEVTKVTETVGSQEIAIQLYQFLTVHFEWLCGNPETNVFRASIFNMRKHERKYFHDVIDDVCASFELSSLSWRNVKYEPQRIKRCEVCFRYFYDASRNGRSMTCFNGGVCEHEYEIRRKRPGTIQEPGYDRSVNIEYIDMQPGASDEEGHAKLIEMEEAAQEGYRCEGDYFNYFYEY